MELDQQIAIRRSELVWKFAATVAALVLLSYIVFFYLYNSFEFGGTQEWGEFGDYFGGILNPVIGLATAYLVLETIRLNKIEFEKSRHYLAEQITIIQRNASIEIQDRRLQHLWRIWEKLLEKQIPLLLPVKINESGSYTTREYAKELFKKILCDYYLINHIINYKKSNEIGYIRDTWRNSLYDEIRLIKELNNYCLELDKTDPSRIVTDFYRNRFWITARLFIAIEIISEEEISCLISDTNTPPAQVIGSIPSVLDGQ